MQPPRHRRSTQYPHQVQTKQTKPNKSNRILLHLLVPNSLHQIQLISQTSSVQQRGIHLLFVTVLLLPDALETHQWLLRKQWSPMKPIFNVVWCVHFLFVAVPVHVSSLLVFYLYSSILQPSIKCTGYGTTARRETFVPPVYPEDSISPPPRAAQVLASNAPIRS